ncbi:MAG: radical SAM protein [Candidatus Abyssobacteria bacterium SURF_5]|uniref:Radical SAM protein n=1 Tax=Abyssobacteria bacterium (strain SURF_5) TaxID=2093360 RepID=A0A3A4P3Z7_ABYX5|nr:MAG: radical SAM protein [Candidatus Abyssubacteria bacterium SURF_5]
MKVVLVNPPELIAGTENGVGFGARTFVKQVRVLPPLGLAYLAAMARRASHEVQIIDANALRLGPEEVLAKIRILAPDIVGITCVTPLFPIVTHIARQLKRLSPPPIVVVGGPQVTIMPELTAQNPAFDYAIEGEAEVSFVKLLDALSGGGPASGINGLLYRDGEGVIRSCEPEPMAVDRIPFPARDLLPNDHYFDMTTESRKASSIMTARGCPFRCSFCERYIRGGHYRPRNPESVVDELEELVNKFGCSEIVIYDDTFTASKKRAADICQKILERGLRFRWDCRTRVDCVESDLLKLMKRAGCSRISYGVESAGAAVLEQFRKNITIEQVEQAFAWTRDARIRILGYFMIGAPGEPRESIQNTIKLSLRLNPDFAYYSIVVPYPGTDMYDRALADGLIPFDYWREYVLSEGKLAEPVPMFEHGDVTREYLQETLKSAYQRFYLRPGYILKRLHSVRSISDFLWHVKMAKATVLT